MKSFLLSLFLLAVLLPNTASAQKASKRKLGKFLKNQIENYAPTIFGKALDLKKITLDDLKIRSGSVKVKGSFKVKKGEGELAGPIQFKSKIATRSGFGLKHIKVHMPGQSFLGIPVYKKVYP